MTYMIDTFIIPNYGRRLIRQGISFLIHEYNVLRSKDQNTIFTVGSSMTNLYKVQVEIPTADQSDVMPDIHPCTYLDPMTSET